MKDITDYFNRSTSEKSPGKSKQSSTPEDKSKSPIKTTAKRGKKNRNKKGVKDDVPAISTDSNLEKDSPKKQSKSDQVSEVNDKQECIEIAQEKETSNMIVEETTSTLMSPKVNAFQFLMNSRNKVIGTNSPGKELDVEEKSPTSASREKLSARKNLLQNWSDSKKAKKRKLEDEEIDKCIKVKLDVRKKRFKALLKVDDEEATKIDITAKNKKIDAKSNRKDVSEKVEVKKTAKKKAGVQSKRKGHQSKNQNGSSILINASSDDFEGEVKTRHVSPVAISEKKIKHKNKKKKKESESKPKGAKSWKMRIKLNVNSTDNCEVESENVIEENVIKPSLIDEDSNVIIDGESNEHKINLEDNISGIYNDEEVGFTTKKSEKKDEKTEFKRVLRSRTTVANIKIVDDVEFLSSEGSDDSFELKSEKKKKVKVAPVFAKAIPKPKIDPKILEAKRNFLLSEMPETLKKKVEKLESFDVPEFDVFPKISHVHQKPPGESFWDLPYQSLPLKTQDSFICDNSQLLCHSIIDSSFVDQSLYETSETIKDVKTIVRNLKTQNDHYPVYKIYRILKEKCSLECKNPIEEKGQKKRRSKTKRHSTNAEDTIGNSSSLEHAMWTEKYKPRKFEDLIGNFQAVSALKKWLERWQEIFNNRKRKRRYSSSDSETDFISSDSGSVNYNSSVNTMIILAGPCGSGKSSSVYAICEEMGLEVIELNASSRRTGKQILQELQEATQSHQVQNNKASVLPFTNPKKQPKRKSEKDTKKLKKCVLLIEDIDLVFDQDDGFIAAVLQISSSTKRPIIVTTSDTRSPISTKFMDEFKTIRFHALSPKSFAIYFQILCLLEGYFVDISSISELFEYNRGDIRKSILELQFWVQSGGQISKNKNLIKNPYNFEEPILSKGEFMENDEPNIFGSLKELNAKIEDYRTHGNIIADFENFQGEIFFNIPLNLDLVKIWWNIPAFITLDSTVGERKRKLKKKLGILSEMYDSLALCDLSFRKKLYQCDKPVCGKRWSKLLTDSLELGEEYTDYSSNNDFMFEWNHYLVDRRLSICRGSKERLVHPTTRNQRLINMALPELKHMSELSRNHQNETELLHALPQFCLLDRKSTVMDYLPTLRNIARSEKVRSQSNMKRHNRFHHYLRNFNIKCSDSVLNFAQNALSIGTTDKTE